jgi:cytochrome c oxidase cbb3-type subunit 2
VYIREGCTACHSQFVRMVDADVVRWGPRRPPEEALAQEPPLIGYRRRGPDLQNVAARRTREWNRLHLVAPRDLAPGSRMPAYGHLFSGGSGDGEALLAYLDSLGADAGPDRWGTARQWRPAARRRAILPDEQARLFAQWCAPCHGDGGRGDGPLATHLLLRPRDLAGEPWRFVPAGEDEALALARLIKFGAPGTAMAGREYLPDDEIAALAAYVQALRRAAKMNGY